MPSWFNDFKINQGSIYVKDTGVRIPLNFQIISEALHWIPFYLREKMSRAFRVQSDKTLKIAFTPVTPRPWYHIHVAVMRAGAVIVKDISKADAVFYFEDQTKTPPPEVPKNMESKAFNFNCCDISKSKVGRVFEEVFGYAMSVDPETYSGMMAVKSEKNGAHDGFAAQGPCPRDPDLVYQRLVDNSIEGGYARDIRCPVIGGEVALIFIKDRPLETRFADFNARVSLHDVDEFLSPDELDKIRAFSAAMGLDWGGIDVLRDNDDGRIYIVDVNKTDMGPPIALPMKDKVKAAKIVSNALVKLILPKH